MKFLYENTIKNFLRMLFWIVIVLFGASLLFGIYSSICGIYSTAQFNSYLWKKCVIPFLLEIAIYAGCKVILASPNIESKKKNYVTFLAFDMILLITALINLDNTILWGSFVLPVMVASIFGYKLYMVISVAVGALSVILCFFVKLFILNDVDVSEYPKYTMHLFIALLFLVISIIVSNLIRVYVEINRNYITSQMENQGELTEKLSKDAMTGLFNHSAFYDLLGRQIKETDKSGDHLAIAVLDIDNFKSVNDTYGHARGDEVILELSAILKDVCRSYIVCRYGGEEFAVIFTGCKYIEVVACMNTVLERFRTTNFEWCDHPITFSCGVCSHFDIRVSAEELFKQADKYLYKAKSTGKNQVVSR